MNKHTGNTLGRLRAVHSFDTAKVKWYSYIHYSRHELRCPRQL